MRMKSSKMKNTYYKAQRKMIVYEISLDIPYLDIG